MRRPACICDGFEGLTCAVAGRDCALNDITKPTGGHPMDENEKVNEDVEHYQAFVGFLRTVATATSLTEVNVAAGALLQDLGEEPADA